MNTGTKERIRVRDFVRDARTEMDLSQESFGALLGLTRQTVWRYEKGEPVPEPVQIAIETILNKHKQNARVR